jgi:hypothetical protein
VTARTLRFILSIFLATRFALFAIAIFAVLRMPINAIEARGFHLPPQPHAFLEAWARYDACWYVVIAEHGYRGPIGSWRRETVRFSRTGRRGSAHRAGGA